jgi:hypothetical protein
VIEEAREVARREGMEGVESVVGLRGRADASMEAMPGLD